LVEIASHLVDLAKLSSLDRCPLFKGPLLTGFSAPVIEKKRGKYTAFCSTFVEVHVAQALNF
jgi:hypothetical protein